MTVAKTIAVEKSSGMRMSENANEREYREYLAEIMRANEELFEIFDLECADSKIAKVGQQMRDDREAFRTGVMAQNAPLTSEVEEVKKRQWDIGAKPSTEQKTSSLSDGVKKTSTKVSNNIFCPVPSFFDFSEPFSFSIDHTDQLLSPSSDTASASQDDDDLDIERERVLTNNQVRARL